MAGGRRTAPLPSLAESREYCREQLARLPEEYKAIVAPARYPVELSPGLAALQAKVQEELRHREIEEAAYHHHELGES